MPSLDWGSKSHQTPGGKLGELLAFKDNPNTKGYLWMDGHTALNYWTLMGANKVYAETLHVRGRH